MRKILLYKITTILAFTFLFAGFFALQAEADLCSDTYCDTGGDTDIITVCCSDGITCYDVAYGTRGGGCDASSPECTSERFSFICPGQPSVWSPYIKQVYYDAGDDSVCPIGGDSCYCWEESLGNCFYCGDGNCDVGEGCDSCEDDCGPCEEDYSFCEVRNLVCPSSPVGIGANFNIPYEFLGTGPSYPYEIRTFLSPTLPDVCITNENYSAGNWHNDIATMTCPGTPGDYNFTIKCYGSINGNSGCGYADDQESCLVNCIGPLPVSIGHIRIQGPGGMIKLNIISAADAIAAGNGVLKVAMTAGDTNSAADLVLTTDSDASPVRIMTPYGIRSWRKLD